MAHYASLYLNVYPSHRGTAILFHGVTGAVDEVTGEFGRTLKRHQRSGQLLPGDIGAEVLEVLLRRGHVTPDGPEEQRRTFMEYARKLHDKRMTERLKHGSLMLVPSYYCNLSCPYCYQNPLRHEDPSASGEVMSPETVDLIFRKTLPVLYAGADRLSRISLNLYGGEPFVGRNRPALDRIFHYTRLHQMPVSAITNGTGLGEFLDCFGIRRGWVASLQISFDGAKMRHDNSRITHYGAGTFDAIIRNIHLLLDMGCRLNLRINASRANVETVKMLRDELDVEEIATHPNVTVYAAAVHNHFDQADPKGLLTRAGLARYLEKNAVNVRTPLDRTAARLAHVMSAEDRIPLDRTQFCMQNMPQAFLIDFRRDIYGCYEEAGNRRLAVGRFDETGAVHLNSRYEAYRSRHVAACEPCSRCSVALTCGGGCPVAARGRETGMEAVFRAHCDSHRELTAKAVQRLFKDRVEGMKGFLYPSEEMFAEQPYA